MAQKTIGLEKQTKTLASAQYHAYLYIIFGVVARMQNENAYCFVEDVKQDRDFTFLFLNFDAVL